MTRLSMLFGACMLLAGLAACSEPADSAADAASTDRASLIKPTEVADQVAYSMGLNLGRNLKAQGADLDIDYLVRGVEDALSGADALLTDEEMMAAVQSYQAELMSAAAGQNKAEGDAFLASNAERSEVVTLPSGLQYEVVKQGDGAKPAATDRVTVHYRGSLNRRHPVRLVLRSRPAGHVPARWGDSRLDRGPAADERRLDLEAVHSGRPGYGENPPPGGPIGPNATLVFVVELLEIE